MQEAEGRQKVVVVGNGMSSWRFCDRLAKGGAKEKIQLTVVGEEPRPA